MVPETLISSRYEDISGVSWNMSSKKTGEKAMTWDEWANYKVPETIYDLMDYSDYQMFCKEFLKCGYIQISMINHSGLCATYMEPYESMERIHRKEQEEDGKP
jgi:hypothetical protein